MISKYGADTVRLFILFGANPEAGMDWSDSALEGNHRQMFAIIEAFQSAQSMDESPSEIDKWLMARVRSNQSTWKEAMMDVSLREGVMISHFEMISDWNWYRRRGGANRSTANDFLRAWIPMLAPATPHIAEEFWNIMGNEALLAEHVLEATETRSGDTHVLAKERYLRNVISSARNLRSMAEKHSEGGISRVVIQTSAQWKSDLARESLRLDSEGFDFKKDGQSHVQSLPIFQNEAMRGEIFQTWMALTVGSKKKRGRIHTWPEGDVSLIGSGLNEAEVLSSNSDFLAEALDVKHVSVYSVGEGEDVAGKARVAFPLEPGIAFL